MHQNKIFLDTNIVIDIIDISRPNHNNLLVLLKQLMLSDFEICISEDMITTLYYISKDKKTTLEFLKNVVFVDWTILVFGKTVLEKAVELSLEKDLDIEDVVQCLCAKENNCDVFITNDKIFHDCGMKIMSSEEFNLVQENQIVIK